MRSSTPTIEKFRYMKKALFFFVLFSIMITKPSLAQAPCEDADNYYNGISGETCGEDLKTELFNLIKDHTSVSYNSIWGHFENTDTYTANNEVYAWDMYTSPPVSPGLIPIIFPYNNPLYQCSDIQNVMQPGECYDREHSFPKSYWGGGDLAADTMYRDLFHIYPGDGYINRTVKSDLPFGEVDPMLIDDKVGNGALKGPSKIEIPGYSDDPNNKVFEPIDEYKGDFARTYFYMATRYENRIADWETESDKGDLIMNGTSFPCYEDWFLEMLIRWHEQDTVSQKERDRNDAACGIQGNRNPFIDNEDYVDRIWGSFSDSSGGNGGNDSPVTFQFEALQNTDEGCPTNPSSIINGGNFTISEGSNCGELKAELTGVDVYSEIEIDIIELADEVFDIVVEGDDLDPEDFLGATFGATGYIANVCGIINTYLVTLTDEFTLEFELVGSLNYSDFVQVYSPVATTIELPIHVSADLVAAQSLCDPADNEAKAEARITGSLAGTTIDVGGEVVQNGPLVEVNYLDETEIVTVDIQPGINTFELEFTGELRVKSSVIAVSPVIACASNAVANSGNTLTVGLFTGENGGPLPEGMTINGLLTGANYANPELGNECDNIPIPEINITDANCGEANGAANITADGLDSLIITWSDGTVGDTVTGLSAGEQYVILSDTLNCSQLFPFIVEDPTIPNVNLPNIAPIDEGDTLILDATDLTNLNLTYLWSTGETTPSIAVDEVGLYTVTITNLDLGCDYFYEINVVSSNVYLISEGDIITDSGLFYDDGGVGGNYTDDESYVITICPETEGEFIVLDFTDVYIIPTEDQDALSVFDGIGSLCVLSPSVRGASTFVASASSGGCLTVRFRSTSLFGVAPGWEAIISTTTDPPDACVESLNGCNSLFTDSGGVNGDYPWGDFQVYQFCPDNPGTEYVVLDFFDVDIHSSDNLAVYDGIGVGCLLAASVSTPQQFVASTNSGGCLTAVFNSNNTLQGDGWQANVSCTTTNTNPPESCACGINPEPANTCDQAPLLNNFEAFCGLSSIQYTADIPGNLEDAFDCGIVHNNSFLRFVPDSETVEIAYQSTGGTNVLCGGFQLAVFSVNEPCNASNSNWNQIACLNIDEGLTANGTFTVGGLTPGVEYYLMIDGSFGSECYYTLGAVSGFETCPLDIDFEITECTPDGSYFVTIPFTGIGDSTNYQVYESNNYYGEIDTVFFSDNGTTDSITIGPYPAGRDYEIIIEGGEGMASCYFSIEGTTNCPIPCEEIQVAFSDECMGDSLRITGTITGGISPYSIYSDLYTTVLFPNQGNTFEFSVPGCATQAIDFTLTDANTCQSLVSLELVTSGCTNPDACNYNPDATIDDGSCQDCSNAAVGETTIQVCDDGDPCTMNDTEIILNCNGVVCVPCVGTIVDCSTTDETTTQACNDGDSCTINDMEVILNCDGTVCVPCAGTVVDCSITDETTTQACDDGDICTINDVEVVLTCDGTVCVPCVGVFDDCNGQTFMQNCDDGDACTTNDKVEVACDGTVCTPCAGEEIVCEDFNLNFDDNGIDWTTNATSGNYTLGDQVFDINVADGDNILQDTEESGAGLKIGIDPNTVTDIVTISYDMPQTAPPIPNMGYASFVIRDLDKKSGFSNQQESVCIYGIFRGNTAVMPIITSLDGSVSVNGNCAEATTDSAISGQDESILVTFNECIRTIVIEYGTGSDAPVADPSYSKIYIADEVGFSATRCLNEDPCSESDSAFSMEDSEPFCTAGPTITQACDDGNPNTVNDTETILTCDGTVCVPCIGIIPTCEGTRLDFTESGNDWADEAVSGTYTVGTQTYSITLDDPDGILETNTEDGPFSSESHEGLKIGINPGDADDIVTLTYDLALVSNSVKFKIRDLDKKNGFSNQQEKVCVYGFLGGNPLQILPTITSFDGSVSINGNCATATTDSAISGDEESVWVEFNECIDRIVIEYGSGPMAPANPTYSSIYIGEEFGFYSAICSPPGCGSQLIAIRDDNVGYRNASVSGNVLFNDLSLDGNEKSANPTPMTPPSNGTLTLLSSGEYSYTPNNGFAGTDQFEYEVIDDNTGTCTTSMTKVAILPVMPLGGLVVNDDDVVIGKNTGTQPQFSGNVLNNDRARNGADLIVTTTPVVAPNHGTLTLSPNGNYQYLPNEGYSGKDGFEYEVCSNENSPYCSIGKVYITILSNPAELVFGGDDFFIVEEGFPLSENVALNDYHTSGEPLSFYSVDEFANPTLTTTANGTVVLNSNGTFTYTPDPDYIGADNFSYTVCASGNCVKATANILVQRTHAKVSLQALLGGALNVNGQTMNTTLSEERRVLPGQIPANPLFAPTPAGQPYNKPPWNYTGTEGANWTDADYDNIKATYNSSVVDWVLVTFRAGITPSTEIAKAAGLLLADGRVVFPERVLPLNNIGNSLYALIEHRNHIGSMSPNLVNLSDRAELTFDFRTQDSYRTPAGVGQIEMAAGVWGLIPGDGEQIVDIVSYDVNGNDKIIWQETNGQFDQYLNSDYNLDGDVNGADKAIWNTYNGNFSSVPR